MGLKKETIKYIESEITNYHKTKYALKKQTERQLSYAGQADAPYSPSFGCDALLLEERRHRRMAEITQAIETVYEQLLPEKQELIRSWYWTRHHGLTWEGIALKLNVDRRTAIRWRTAIIEAIGRELGEQ